ncbi:glutathione S-transferase family protein [Lyngbya confervoides]|uniref:Glutathione S-transferase C-terminal domain-containing protein n=1 Tax=Lyngbya confervoides BDU141951 TaxID=1574623 RepID=A0ABD4T4D6_9CYAN|nr:glutathione S-transferase C-terminal domain-containing protein [Lyngbya confervoides]MCM1983310.1 glutathione S-transferase C-terminal domain-containing protein [Lyngbya confervoides BDU141951]
MGLPPKSIIRAGRWTWHRLWQVMMSQMAPRDAQGAYQRPKSEFLNSLPPDSPPQPGQYRLIVGWGCPWAHRTLVVRALKGLETSIPLDLVHPAPAEGGWVFANGTGPLRSLYQRVAPGYQGRATVPVLWDSAQNKIINNESAEILVILNEQFNHLAAVPDLDLYPEGLRSEIDTWNQKIYTTVNNGVYQCGFAQTQHAYTAACQSLFATLDHIEGVLGHQRFLCGSDLTLADVRLFTTLIRFDAVYYALFKCNLRRIRDYLHLSGYLRDLYQLPGVKETCHLDAIKQDYYGNLFPLNPSGIIPLGPHLDDLEANPQREHLSAR